MRILQEDRGPGIDSGHNGVIADNIVVYSSMAVAEWINVDSYVARGTLQTFRCTLVDLLDSVGDGELTFELAP